MPNRLSTVLFSIACVITTLGPAPSVEDPKKPTPAEPRLTVKGEITHPLDLSAADFAKLPHVTIKAKDHHGVEAEYEGVPLSALLKVAGLELGENLRGPALSLYLLVEAADGYRAVFALPELDPAFNDRMIILADRANNAALKHPVGPLRIIVPGEKRASRWVRQVVSLKIVKA